MSSAAEQPAPPPARRSGPSRGTLVATGLGIVFSVLAGYFVASVKTATPRAAVGASTIEAHVALASAPDAPLHQSSPGEALVVQLRAPDAGYLGLLSLDETGAARGLFPLGPKLTQVAQGENLMLPWSASTPGEHRLWLLLCARPHPVEALRRTLQSGVHGFAPPDNCLKQPLGVRVSPSE